MPIAIERMLWCNHQGSRIELPQSELLKRVDPIVILGEAGMGKSRLLEWLGSHLGYARCTARQLINRHDPRTLLGGAQVLVIDALDEVSAQKEGDAVDLVLRKLGELGYPRFVISCRVADWRSATGTEAIREQYTEPLLEAHLKPFTDGDATAFLNRSLGEETAKEVVGHFNRLGLQGLLGNPQTLELIASVARTGPLPTTRGELFERAVEVLRVEHSSPKANTQLARQTGIDAAGAAFTGLILTGSEAVVRTAAANTAEGELLVSEAQRLPGGEALEATLGTRLFKADGSDRFSYSHRRIGEFLGARWLAGLADTKRKRRRLLSLFHSYRLVPASLRGIHAWLVRDPALALAVIAADPMGVIEYGDADELSLEQARALLKALGLLAVNNPRFRGWGPYSVRAIARPELAEELRKLVVEPETPFGLRLLVLEAIKGTTVAFALVDELRSLVLDPKATFANRSASGEVLVELRRQEDWQKITRSLLSYGDHLSVRLAIELVDEIGYELFDDNLIVDLVVAHTKDADRTIGILMGLERRLPESRIDGVLDCLIQAVEKERKPREENQAAKYPNHGVTDFAYLLVARRVAAGGVTPEKLWFWLKPFYEYLGFQRETRKQLNDLLQQQHVLRQGVQRLVLLQQPDESNFWQREVRLVRRSSGLKPTTNDVVALLETLDPANRSDERWRDIVQSIRHDNVEGAEVRAAARPFASHRTDLLGWLDRLAEPEVSESQKREADRERKRKAKLKALHAEHREHFLSHIDQVRAGEYDKIIDPAKAYLKLFSDQGDGISAHERISEWLGDDIARAAHTGFEAFISTTPPMPSAKDIAESLAEGRGWDAGYIIVAALAERARTAIGFSDLPDERVMAGLFELRRTKIDQHAGIVGLEEVLAAEIRSRGIWEEAMRLYHEPQLEAHRDHVDGLSALMRDDSPLGAELASEWLVRFSTLLENPETELIDRLLSSNKFEALINVLPARMGLADKRRQNFWDAVGLIVSFKTTAKRLGKSTIESELLWHLRRRTGGRYGEGTKILLSPAQIEWIVTTFRSIWPANGRPNTSTRGDENPWDASEYIFHLVNRLGNDPSLDAVATLERLRSAPIDGYSETIRVVVAEQARIRVESNYVPPTIDAIDSIARDRAPVDAGDLQALMLEELAIVQAKIRSDDAESWRGFFDDNHQPFAEERCRDYLLGLLRQGSEGITLEPEKHVAADKEVDIACSVGDLCLPIEVKGQWHPELWRGADAQLDRLYAQDWRADKRGIYLVLWFGENMQSNKRLTGPGAGGTRPKTPDELCEMLTERSYAARDGRIRIFVLDLART